MQVPLTAIETGVTVGVIVCGVLVVGFIIETFARLLTQMHAASHALFYQ